jgi:hypothetical protein
LQEQIFLPEACDAGFMILDGAKIPAIMEE